MAAAGSLSLAAPQRVVMGVHGHTSDRRPDPKPARPTGLPQRDVLVVQVPDLADELPDWSGRIVVDATNQFAQYEPTYSGFVDLGHETGSEWVARHLPGATVIKAFNAMFAEYIMADPRHHDGRQVLFFAGDDDAVNAEFAAFGEALGFAPVRVGGLREGGRLMQLGGPLSALHVIKQD